MYRPFVLCALLLANTSATALESENALSREAQKQKLLSRPVFQNNFTSEAHTNSGAGLPQRQGESVARDPDVVTTETVPAKANELELQTQQGAPEMVISSDSPNRAAQQATNERKPASANEVELSPPAPPAWIWLLAIVVLAAIGILKFSKRRKW